MNTYILSIDQGTTSTRAIIFDEKSNIIGISSKEIKQYYPKPGWVEQDPHEIWLSVLTVITQALTKAKINANQIKAIGITNQRETTIIWDKETGEPIHNAISWQSRQTDDIVLELKNKGHDELFKNKTGLVIDSYFSATKIRWLLNKYGHLNQEDLMFGTIDTWLIYKFTGGVHKTDYSNASRTMLFNIHEQKWDEELLKILNINIKLLPEVVESSSLFGETKPYHFYGYKVPITGVLGDQQAALFGQTCFDYKDVKNTYGTGCFLLMNTGSEPIKSNHGLITTIAWKLNNEITYALEGSVFIAGSSITWLRDGLNLIDKANETEKMAQSLSSNEGVYFVPAFVGLGAPYWDTYARGALFGITSKTNRTHIVRATLEAVCYQSMDLLNAMEKDINSKIKNLKVDGGASSNNFLMQFQANILNETVIRPKVLETTALGAAYIAGLYVKYWDSLDDIKKNWQLDKTYTPNLAKNKRETYINNWHNAINATRLFKPKGDK